ncbi:MAG TPA: adenosylcobinamide-GDP ribazoletransferase [Candidatus Avidehalobacter gallistercoris]|uniref:Adenosylcobinamide-GDP ribazoletransferase n=1 Tax=Candidatus Avidehalobacter gallistercoris TaxID=2840694 RepID=A0A9D1KXZ1_9FIRM|nr:adenosylcobinamide-GDP ribazoletransferase [Candidatus Avidehalobacter gallistercoris]
MNIWKSMLVALSLYSKLPVPQINWTRQNMAYALAFFPLVGLLVSAVLLLWCWLSVKLAFGRVLFAAGCTLIPVLITGGIHMDGFCDVSDALSSWQTKERRLEILKDSHIGAFALISLVCYLLAYFAVWTEIRPAAPVCFWAALMFPLCRTLSGLGIVNLRCAKKSGLAATFAGNAERSGVTAALCCWLVLIAGVMLGMNWLAGVLSLGLAAGCFWLFRRVSYRDFGGINGDLAGWFLQMLELGWLIMLLVLQKLQVL